MAKYVFVTGGVVSSIGKGITAAAIGRLLKSRGITVSVQKLDPYLNVDPGTMSPYQHGEVFVTTDGAETDLDLGHYERFIDSDLTQSSNVTAGQIYTAVIARERRGDFLGGTIQVIPHVTNAIKAKITGNAEESGAQVVIVEVGGTVGDIESLPFLEAIRQVRNDVGRDDALFVHVTYLPYIITSGELKTKPTQHSVRELRSIGIQPDVIAARSDYPIDQEIIEKLSLFCDVETRAVIPLPNVDTIYRVPVHLEETGLDAFLVERLGLEAAGPPDLKDWRELVRRIEEPKPSLSIAIVGKYVELHDSYLSVKEALHHAGLAKDVNVDIEWVPAEDLEHPSWERYLERAHGIIVPGGFGSRGIEGMVRAARYARERELPFLGLCLGMQVMVIEYARHVLGWIGANSTEFDLEAPYPVIHIMEDQENVEAMGGTMRLGAYPCELVPGTRTHDTYAVPSISERHRHRFEFNNRFKQDLRDAGLVASGIYKEKNLVEICEIRDHPFMLGSQFHPEFQSRPTRPHPLFREFVAAATAIHREGEQPPLLPDGEPIPAPTDQPDPQTRGIRSAS